jgi:hypothetical protein
MGTKLDEIRRELASLSAAGELTAERAAALFEEGANEAERLGDVVGARLGRLLASEIRMRGGSIVYPHPDWRGV